MITAPALEEIAIVKHVPDVFEGYRGNDCYFDLLLNEPKKRFHKSAEYVLFQSDMLSLGIEYDKIKKLYSKHQDLFPVDFRTFFGAYKKMSDIMAAVIPENCDRETEISEEDRCIYNYYGFDNTKIIFNLFFDDDAENPIAQINIRSNGKFLSLEGTIEKAASYLKNIIDKNSNA